MKQYPTYKSKKDNQWFDAVPNEWEIMALKHTTKYVKTGGTPSTKETKYYENGEIDWYTPEDINMLELADAKKKISKLALEDGEVKLFAKDSLLLVGIGATIGKVGILTKDATSNQQINAIFFNKKLNPKFGLYYFYSIAKTINDFSSTSTMGIFNQTKTKAIYLPVPSKDEQTQIVKYLDFKTNLIDEFITNRQKQIDLLKEQKAGIINKAVTKGIDPNAKMKPSGIVWIEDIPKHWEVWKVSRIFKKIGSGTTPKANTSKYYDNGTIPWVNTGDLNDSELYECKSSITELAFEEHSTLKFYDKNTLLVAMYGATIGKASILKFKACTNQACCALSDSKLINIKYAFYWFISNKQHIVNLSYGGGQPNISQDVIKGLKIPLPVLEEQEAILEFIKSETFLINELISKYQKQIELMQEYRTAIISQAVTGKIDVRDWQPKTKEILS